jgi:hypothetical protein
MEWLEDPLILGDQYYEEYNARAIKEGKKEWVDHNGVTHNTKELKEMFKKRRGKPWNG